MTISETSVNIDATSRMHGASPRVTVILVNYKNAEMTLRCVDSLFNMVYDNFLVIVVDNASSAESYDRLKDAAQPVTIVRSTENLGFARACNLAIAGLEDDHPAYVWLLNNDAIVHQDALLRLVALAEGEKKVGAVGSKIVHMHSNSIISAGGGVINSITGTTKNLTIEQARKRLDYICGASFLIRWDALKSVGPFREDYFLYWEDADYCARLRRDKWALAFAEDSIIYHAESTTVGKGSVLFDYLFSRASVIFVREHFRHYWLVPLTISLGGRVVKRIGRNNFAGVFATCKGFVHGLQGKLQRPGEAGRAR